MFRARPSILSYLRTRRPRQLESSTDTRARTRTRTRDSRQENQPPSNQPFTHCKQLGRDQSLARIVCVVVPRLLLVLQLPNPRLRPRSYFALQPPLPEPPASSKNQVLEKKRWPSLICLPGRENPFACLVRYLVPSSARAWLQWVRGSDLGLSPKLGGGPGSPLVCSYPESRLEHHPIYSIPPLHPPLPFPLLHRSPSLLPCASIPQTRARCPPKQTRRPRRIASSLVDSWLTSRTTARPTTD